MSHATTSDQLKRYDLIAIDMDGTMLTSQKVISSRTLEAMRAARDAGKHVVVASGRGVSELTVYPELMDVCRYGICMNGSLVYDFVEKNALFEQLLDPTAVDLALAEALRADTMLQVYVGGNPHVSPDDACRMAHWFMAGHQEQFKTTTTKVADIAGFARAHRSELGKFISYFASTDARQAARDALLARGINAGLVYSEVTSLEVVPKGANKGTGLARLCAKIGVAPERTIAVGDAFNDLEMLEAAGLGVAMANANEAALAAADVTVADNDHDGVAEAIEKYLLG